MGATRRIYINDAQMNANFCDNRISNTKYTALNFLPKNLTEQFSRNMNRYFLLIGLLQLIQEITPTNPLTTIGPLIVIFAITATKEWIDHVHRARADKVANERKFTVLKRSSDDFGSTASVSIVRKEILSQNIRPGDILVLEDNEELPCDVCVLATADGTGICYTETANLDGESDLKPRYAPPATKTFTEANLLDFKGVIECAHPNPEIYVFDSKMLMAQDPAAATVILTYQNTLLQATHVRSSTAVYGVAVYTGNETKFGMNKREPPNKMTRTDVLVDRITAGIFAFQLFLVVVFGVWGSILKDSFRNRAWYVAYSDDESWFQPLVIPLRFLLLNSTMIPISLKVTMDVAKLLYARFVEWDSALVDKQHGGGPIARNTGIGEDLGQIEYIFTDKTGTLTENKMLFKKCSINGVVYGVDGSGKHVREDRTLSRAAHGGNDAAALFLRALALNNSLVPIEDDEAEREGAPEYRATSPDENALMEFAAAHGVFLARRAQHSAVLCVRNSGGSAASADAPFVEEEFNLLHVLAFNSDRKRMSVLVQRPGDPRVLVIVKGADDVLFERLRAGQDDIVRATAIHIEQFASTGLRALAVAYRWLDADEYAAWARDLAAAEANLAQRQTLVEACEERVESNLVLLGATAIEDQLQPGVPATIATLREAGIRFWMLTGDKYSTALEIATACRLRTSADAAALLKIEAASEDEAERAVKEATTRMLALSAKRASDREESALRARSLSTGSGGGVARWRGGSGGAPGGDAARAAAATATASTARAAPFARGGNGATVVVTGAALSHVWARCADAFLDLCLEADAVVCCRLTPRQKAMLVRGVKERGATALAVGDGGNDVPMIQEAHVGVGLVGEEGLQASRAADYSLGRFRFLERLLLVHGRESYLRSAFLAQFSFYKSFVFCFIQIGFGFANAFSGTSLFNSLSIMSYNMFLFLPILSYIVNRDVSPQSVFAMPSLYRVGPQREAFNAKTFRGWAWRGFWQGAVILASTLASFDDHYAHAGTGRPAGYEAVGMNTFAALVFVISVVLMGEMYSIATIQVVLVWGAVALAYVVFAIASEILALSGFVEYKIMAHTMNDPVYYFNIILCVVACVLPIFAARAFRFRFEPNVIDTVRIAEARAPALGAEEARLLSMEAGTRSGSETDSARGEVSPLEVA